MEKCLSGHAEIVHDEWNCPMCEAGDEIAKLENHIEGLKDEIQELKERE